MKCGNQLRRFTSTEGAREQGSEGARERGSAGAERRTSFFLSLTLSLALSLCFGTAAQAACHVVTPSGSGDGSGRDWNNAINWNTISFIRGDTYYLRTGAYGSKSFQAPEAGTT